MCWRCGRLGAIARRRFVGLRLGPTRSIEVPHCGRRRSCWPVPSGVAVLHVLPVIGRIERPVYPRALTSLFKVHHLRREVGDKDGRLFRSEEHTSELQSLMRISYAVFCLTKKTTI